jgi:hypothetical protein
MCGHQVIAVGWIVRPLRRGPSMVCSARRMGDHHDQFMSASTSHRSPRRWWRPSTLSRRMRLSPDQNFAACRLGASVGVETGPMTPRLFHQLRSRGLDLICLDARHARAALRMQLNKTDRNDADNSIKGRHRERQIEKAASRRPFDIPSISDCSGSEC